MCADWMLLSTAFPIKIFHLYFEINVSVCTCTDAICIALYRYSHMAQYFQISLGLKQDFVTMRSSLETIIAILS